MWTDINDLKKFYTSNLGTTAQTLISRQLKFLWPNVRGQRLVGIGYTIPYLKMFRENATSVTSAMPAPQGACCWPEKGAGLTTLVDDLELPFSDLSIDKVLLVHCAEYSDHIRPSLREIWRIMKSNGHIIIVVPNRRGVWARFEHTPFGRGLPYSAGQLSRLLQANMFSPINTRWAICVPPVKSRIVLSAASTLERISASILSNFAGVIVIEAVKQIYAGHPLGQSQQNSSILALPQRSRDI